MGVGNACASIRDRFVIDVSRSLSLFLSFSFSFSFSFSHFFLPTHRATCRHQPEVLPAWIHCKLVAVAQDHVAKSRLNHRQDVDNNQERNNNQNQNLLKIRQDKHAISYFINFCVIFGGESCFAS
jgi:hypothetical protein